MRLKCVSRSRGQQSWRNLIDSVRVVLSDRRCRDSFYCEPPSEIPPGHQLGLTNPVDRQALRAPPMLIKIHAIFRYVEQILPQTERVVPWLIQQELQRPEVFASFLSIVPWVIDSMVSCVRFCTQYVKSTCSWWIRGRDFIHGSQLHRERQTKTWIHPQLLAACSFALLHRPSDKCLSSTLLSASQGGRNPKQASPGDRQCKGKGPCSMFAWTEEIPQCHSMSSVQFILCLSRESYIIFTLVSAAHLNPYLGVSPPVIHVQCCQPREMAVCNLKWTTIAD